MGGAGGFAAASQPAEQIDTQGKPLNPITRRDRGREQQNDNRDMLEILMILAIASQSIHE
jgi:hypothetical protein